MNLRTTLVVALLVLSACAEAPVAPVTAPPGERECKVGGGNATIDYVDFVMLDGTMFTNNYPAKNHLMEGDLGEPVDEVLCRLSDNVTDPGYDPQHGDAGFLDPGTIVYAVKGYDPSFRVAAKGGLNPDRYTLYEADTVPVAAVGRDLLDIEGKVRYIGINSHSDGTTEIARIDDPAEVRRLVQMVLSAPVLQDDDIPGYKGEVIVEFHLEDGTSVLRNFFPSGPELMRGIHVPEAFADAVKEALSEP